MVDLCLLALDSMWRDIPMSRTFVRAAHRDIGMSRYVETIVEWLRLSF